MRGLKSARRFCVVILQLQFALCGLLVGQPKTATVHLEFVNFRGEGIRGVGTVDLFQVKDEGSPNLAALFHQNTATNVPYGTYRLKAYQQGYYSADRTVLVHQKDVWIVLQLTVGVENGPTRYILPGRVTGVRTLDGLVWIRAQGLYSGVIADTKAGEDGRFEIAGLTDGVYILTTRQQNHILDMRVVQLPSNEKTGAIIPVEINVKQ